MFAESRRPRMLKDSRNLWCCDFRGKKYQIQWHLLFQGLEIPLIGSISERRIFGVSVSFLAEVFYNVNYVNVNYSVKNSTVDCKYLLFLQDFFFRLKPKQYKKCQYSWLFKKTIWKLIKNKVNIYNQQLNFWLNNWRLHNWRSRKPRL